MKHGSRPLRGCLTHRAFTLVELLVVIAIVGALIALLLSAVQAARNAARRDACAHKLRQQIVAALNYESSRGYLPPGGAFHAQEAQSSLSWRVLLLPYLEQAALHNRIGPNGGLGENGATDWLGIETRPPEVFRCPQFEPPPAATSTELTIANYSGVAGAARAGEGCGLKDIALCGDVYQNGVFIVGRATQLRQITDGLSSTLAIGERTYDTRGWMNGAIYFGAPRKTRICSEAAHQIAHPLVSRPETYGELGKPLVADPTRKLLLNELFFGSNHAGGAHFAYADGSVHFLDEEMPPRLLEDLATIDGKEIVP